MQLKDCRENYYFHSGKASDVVRNLGFVGLGTVWVFKENIAGNVTIPSPLILAAITLVLALVSDFFQYASGSILWSMYHRSKERKGTKEDDVFLAPPSVNWPALFFFWTKIALIVFSYSLLLRFLFGKLCNS